MQSCISSAFEDVTRLFPLVTSNSDDSSQWTLTPITVFSVSIQHPYYRYPTLTFHLATMQSAMM